MEPVPLRAWRARVAHAPRANHIVYTALDVAPRRMFIRSRRRRTGEDDCPKGLVRMGSDRAPLH